MSSEFAIKVVAALANALDNVVPPEFRVSGSEGMLSVRPRGPGLGSLSDIGAIIDRSPKQLENLHSAGLCALNAVQDFVSVTSGQPWPLDSARGYGNMAECHVALANGRLTLWYGSANRVVLDVASIDVAGLG